MFPFRSELRRFPDDHVKLGRGERPQGGGLHIPQARKGDHQGGDHRVVRRLEEDRAVVGAERPEGVRDLAAGFLGGGLEAGGAESGLMDVLESLGGELQEGKIGGLRIIGFSCVGRIMLAGVRRAAPDLPNSG